MENPRPHPTQSFIIWRGACVELKKQKQNSFYWKSRAACREYRESRALSSPPGPVHRWSQLHAFSVWQTGSTDRPRGLVALSPLDVRMCDCGKSHDCLHSVKIQPGGCLVQSRRVIWKGLCVSVHAAPAQASMGLETMLFGVSGSWDDIDATSLPVEFEPGPPSEKLTCRAH